MRGPLLCVCVSGFLFLIINSRSFFTRSFCRNNWGPWGWVSNCWEMCWPWISLHFWAGMLVGTAPSPSQWFGRISNRVSASFGKARHVFLLTHAGLIIQHQKRKMVQNKKIYLELIIQAGVTEKGQGRSQSMRNSSHYRVRRKHVTGTQTLGRKGDGVNIKVENQ